MGGSLCVGIRRLDGSEYIAERWTNSIPYWCANPRFWEDGQVVDRYIAEAADDSPPLKIITPSEYGVIFFDHIQKKVYSRQDYTAIGRAYCWANNNPYAEHLVLLRKTNWITKYIKPEVGLEAKPPFEHEATPEEQEAFWKVTEAHALNPKVDTGGQSMQVFFEPSGWTIDDNNNRGAYIWSEVRKWLRDNKWKSPAWSLKRVRKEYELDEEEETAPANG